MSRRERLEIIFCDCTTEQLRKMSKRDPERLARIEGAIDRVRELGWSNAVKVELIKLLRNADGPIGEIRYQGRDAQRLIFFYVDSATNSSAIELYITDVLPKSKLKPNRLAAASRRATVIWNAWTTTGEC